jgi:Short C-terminal domain/Phospholipase_D-nuclease N-terminal
MVFAASYPFGGIFWSMLIFFFWVIWIWILVTILMDVFRRHDIGGWSKALWIVFVVVLPYLGVLVYLIANHDGMTERRMSEMKASQQQFDSYVRDAAGSGGVAAEIEKAKGLLDSGAITPAEFEAIKAKALA